VHCPMLCLLRRCISTSAYLPAWEPPGCAALRQGEHGAQEFHDTVFAGSLVTNFHREYDGDACASVGPWVDDARVVAFTVQLKLPAFIRKAIGAAGGPGAAMCGRAG